MNAHDTYTVGTFVLDKHRKHIKKTKNKLTLIADALDIVDLSQKLYQVKMIIYAKLSHKSCVLNLLICCVKSLFLR